MENIISRIKIFRKEKGYSYETMGFELNMSPAAYRKIEINETKLTVERLFQIIKILDVSLEDVLMLEKNNGIVTSNTKGNIIMDHFIDFHTEYKEKTAKIELLYEERIKEQATTISQLIELMGNKK